jgi:hypothetical protein
MADDLLGDDKPAAEAEPGSLYGLATIEIQRIIKIYLRLVEETANFQKVTPASLGSPDERTILLAGIRSNLNPFTSTPEEAAEEWERRRAIPFDIETSVTTGLYFRLRGVAGEYFDALREATSNFRAFDATFIQANPHFLPLLQHVGRFPSKSKLKVEIGSVSDISISRPAAERLAAYLTSRVDPDQVNREQVLVSISSTLEGIVRDLVGRILLESVVTAALEARHLQFQREDSYEHLPGVVYDFRADFVLPDAENPKVFIEVRKSSSRHASLYAKDKMFSAINWKGRHKDLLGVVVVDGAWTAVTLSIMANVFDYVIPLSASTQLAEIVEAYVKGDKSKLKWIIDFRITANKQ